MTWARRRVWSDVSVAAAGTGWEVRLDGRPLRTPAKAPLLLPGAALAGAVAAEWAAQGAEVDPRTMPVTRLANSAIDRVAPQQAEVVAIVAAYGASDLLCYRAEAPAELVLRQAEGWDPFLDWASAALGARLRVTTGVLPVAQDAAALSGLSAEVRALDPFRLAALHDLVALSGSLVLGLAVAKGACPAAEAWDLSRIDEDWQAELWGRDAEAEAAAHSKRADFLTAARVLVLCDASDAAPAGGAGGGAADPGGATA